MIYPLLLFRIVLVLTAWVAILYDNYKHRDLRLVAYAYTLLVLGTITSYFTEIYKDLPLHNEVVTIATHVLAILAAGILFFLTAYAAHQKMGIIQNRTRIAFKGLK